MASPQKIFTMNALTSRSAGICCYPYGYRRCLARSKVMVSVLDEGQKAVIRSIALDEVARQVGPLKQQISALDEKMSGRFAGLAGGLYTAEEKLEGFDAKLDTVNNELNGQKEAISKLGGLKGEFRNVVSELKTAMAEQKAEIIITMIAKNGELSNMIVKQKGELKNAILKQQGELKNVILERKGEVDVAIARQEGELRVLRKDMEAVESSTNLKLLGLFLYGIVIAVGGAPALVSFIGKFWGSS